MGTDSDALALLKLYGLFVLAAVLYGIAALWVINGRTTWLQRAAPLVLLLAALVPLGAYELVFLFAVQAAAVIGTLSLVRSIRGRAATAPSFADVSPTTPDSSPRPQFRLSHVLKGCALLAATLALCRLAPPNEPVSALRLGAWGQQLLYGLGLATVTLVAYGVVGTQVVRRAISTRRLARVVLYGLSLLGAWILITAYVHLRPPQLPPPEPTPVANGYVDLVRAASSLNWTAVPGQDADEVTVAACQAFSIDNATIIARMREALSNSGRVSSEYTSAYIGAHLPDIQALRELCRALAVESKAAETDPSKSLQCHLDMIRVANATCRGGLAIDDLVADAIERVGLAEIARKLPGLNESDLATLCVTLPQLLAQREPIGTILEREDYFARTSSGWVGRLMYWVEGETFSLQATLEGTQLARSRVLTWSRLILTEAAIRQHALAEGSLPNSLTDLVPKYLSEVPQDPFGDGPLIYRRTTDGYLLYSVGSNGVDDGGQRALSADAVAGTMDPFVDADAQPAESEPEK